MKISTLLAAITLTAASSLPLAMLADGGIGVAVVKADGTVHAVELDHIDRIDIADDNVTVHHRSGQSASHDIADIERIDIGVAVAGIDRVMEDDGDIAVWPTTVDNTLNIRGAAQATPIAVYNIGGACVATATAGTDATVTLDLSAIAPGAYIVTIGNHSVKIIKK